MMKPFDDSFREMDAHYSVELRSDGFDLIVESRGGSDHGPNAARNSDYARALEQHLIRMVNLGVVLLDVQVASSVAMKLPVRDRSVGLDHFKLPLTLSLATNVRELRYSIGRAAAAFGRTDDRGNRTKRMRLCMQWPGAAGMTSEDIERMLSSPIDEVTDEKPTDDPVELQYRVAKAMARIRLAAKRGAARRPRGQSAPLKTIGKSYGFVRDPNVIAWVLSEAAGNCEICGDAAPFLRADGDPFLEIHHVRPLGEGGPDTVDNAAACCPNCHRRLHFDPNRDNLRKSVINSIARLKDYPSILSASVVEPAETTIR